MSSFSEFEGDASTPSVPFATCTFEFGTVQSSWCSSAHVGLSSREMHQPRLQLPIWFIKNRVRARLQDFASEHHRLRSGYRSLAAAKAFCSRHKKLTAIAVGMTATFVEIVALFGIARVNSALYSLQEFTLLSMPLQVIVSYIIGQKMSVAFPHYAMIAPNKTQVDPK